MKNKPVELEKITRKSFTFKKNAVSLNFSLRIDIKQELSDFLECLVYAVREVEEELKKVNK